MSRLTPAAQRRMRSRTIGAGSRLEPRRPYLRRGRMPAWPADVAPAFLVCPSHGSEPSACPKPRPGYPGGSGYL